MFKSKSVAGAAAFSLFSMSFLLAYATTGTASAQTRAYEAPAVIAPDLAAPVATPLSDAAQSDDAADEQAPQAAAPASLAQLVAAWNDNGNLDEESRCLATAVFYESRSESLDGQLAVANVVIGRARSGRFPSSLCGVVKQAGQFGFVRRGQLPEAPAANPHWRTAQAIAQIALDARWQNPVEGALYFHTARTPDNWDRERVAHIGGHVFYR